MHTRHARQYSTSRAVVNYPPRKTAMHEMSKMDRGWFLFSTEAAFLVFAIALTAGIWAVRSVSWIDQRRETLAGETVHGFSRGANAPNGLWLFGEDAVVVIVVKEEAHIPQISRLFPEAEVRIVRTEEDGET
jgi:hypothetical protein